MGKQPGVRPRLSRRRGFCRGQTREASGGAGRWRRGQLRPFPPAPAASCRVTMFRMLSSSFEDDPFFADSFLAHRESMRHMMRSFSEPFGRDLLSISDSRGRIHNHREHGGDEDSLMTTSSSLVPFGRFGGMHADVNPFQSVDRMMCNMRNGIQDLQRNFGHLSMDPNGHSFCSSSVMTYSKVGDEPPKVFQAATQTRRAPGGIKETRRAMRDSDSGLEKMSVGHHIHDRAHVIKKSKNNKTGDEEVNQEFINMNENDAHAFDDEWQNEVLKYRPNGCSYNLENNRMKSMGQDNPVSRERKRREKIHRNSAIESGRRPNIFADKLNVKGSPAKINKK